MDGDGYDDFVIGAFKEDEGGTDAGAAYLILGGKKAGASSLYRADAKLLGDNASALATSNGGGVGRGAAGAGDLDDDGMDDFLVGSQGWDSESGSGSAYVIFGPVTPGTSLLSSAGTVFEGKDHSALGTAVAGGGDVDGDGLRDVVFSAPSASSGATNNGEVYLIPGAGI